MSANPARLMNSSFRPLHSIAFFQAGSAKTNRWQHVPSHTSQLSKSRTQRSICLDVTCSATSIIPARIRASCTPVPHSSSASSRSRPILRASRSIFGFATPYTTFARIPYRAMPSIFRCSPRERSSRNARAQLHFSLASCRKGLRLERFAGVEEDRDRAFINQLHGHHCLKNSGRHSHAEFAKRRTKFIIQGFGLLGRSGGNKARPPLPARVAVERKLGHDHRTAFHVQQRPAHLSRMVLENAQVRALFRHRGSSSRSILAPHAEQNHQPGADFARHFCFHGHTRAADSL